MKKKLIYACIFILIGCLIYLISRKLEEREKRSGYEYFMPSFNFYSLDGHLYGKDSLSSGKKTLLFYFSPDCEHCQYQTSQIVSHFYEMKNTNILFISASDQKSIINFQMSYGLFSYPGITLLRDSTDNFYNDFGTHSTPAIFIYDSTGHMLVKYIGEVKMQTLLEWLK